MTAPMRAPDGPPEGTPAPDGFETLDQRQRALERAEAEAAVADVLKREELKVARLAARERARPSAPSLRQWLLLALLLFNAYVWFGKPKWLEFNLPPPPTYDYYVNGWKVAVYLQRNRIEEYRSTTGHVPSSVQQAGPPVHGVEYTPRTSDTYELQAGNGPKRVVYTSSDSVAMLVGRSLLQATLSVGGVR